MIDGYRNAPRFPYWWTSRFWGVGCAAVFGCWLLFGAWLAFGGQVTLPPITRAENLCLALGAEPPCTPVEIGHVRGTLTFLANDVPGADPELTGLLTVRGRSYAARIPAFGAPTELAIWQVVRNPETVWPGTIATPATWPTFRLLADVSEGVPVLVTARPAHGGTDATTDPAMLTLAPLRVRFALMALR